MKTTKKLLAAILTLVMVFSLGSVSAYATGNTTPGEITIQNATVDKTYSAYKLLDATVGVSGEVAYTIDSDSVWFDTVNNSNLFVLRETSGRSATGATVYSVEQAANASAENVLKLFKDHFFYDELTESWTCDITGADPEAQVIADSSSLSLPVTYGYYLITSTLGSLVTINTNHPTVTVIDKNQGPSWDNTPDNPPEGTDPNPGKVIIENGEKKTVNSASYGDSVTFDIGVNATNYVGEDQISYYYIKDTIDAGFDYDLNDQTPAAFDPVVTVNGQTLTKGDDYLVSQTGRSFEITIKWAELTIGTDNKVSAIESIYPANSEIHVQYSATLHEDGRAVIIGCDGNLNTANFTYSTNKTGDVPPTTPNVPYDEEKEKTTVTYVYALGIQKVDGEQNPLNGAEFSVADIYVVENSAGVYSLCSEDADNATQIVVTDANGQIVIKGVKAGTYTFTEVKAPAGYNLLTDSFSVEAALAESYTNTTIITYYYDVDGKLVDKTETTEYGEIKTYSTQVAPVFGVGIENHTGVELPSTGGMGTTIFYAIGGMLMVVAAVLLVSRKKMSAFEK